MLKCFMAEGDRFDSAPLGFVVCYQCLALVAPTENGCPACGAVIHPLSRGITVAQFGNEQARLRAQSRYPKLTRETAALRRAWVDSPGSARVGEWWTCPACSTSNPPESDHCARCGRSATNPQWVPETKPKHLSTTVVATFVVIAVALVVTFFWLILASLPWYMLQW